jgi:hypothetical protein
MAINIKIPVSYKSLGTKGQIYEYKENTKSLNTVPLDKCRSNLQGPKLGGRVAIRFSS